MQRLKALRSRVSPSRSSFLKDTRGVAAVEFALILPVLLIVMMGALEVSSLLNCDRKVSQIASSVADLVSQSESVSSSDISDIMTAATTILKPYDASDLQVIVGQITFDADGNATVEWSSSYNATTSWTNGSAPPFDVPEALAEEDSHLIVGWAKYTYTPTYGKFISSVFPEDSTIDLEHIFYLRPRLTESVTYD